MICPKCGSEAGESKFCPECGTPITQSTNFTDYESNPVYVENTEMNSYTPEMFDNGTNAYMNGEPYYGSFEKIEEEKKEKKKKTKTIIAICCSGFVFLIIMIIVLSIASSNYKAKKEENESKKQNLIELTDTVVCLNRERNDIRISDFSFSVKNNSNKTIEHISFTLKIYNKDGIEKGNVVEICDEIIHADKNVAVIPDNYIYNYLFEDIFIDDNFIGDLDSITISEVEITYSDTTTETIQCNKKIDKYYYCGVIDDVYYYCDFNEHHNIQGVDYGIVSSQKSMDISGKITSEMSEIMKEHLGTIPKINGPSD